MTRPRLLILSYTDARRDPRVFRQVTYLKEHFQITLAGLADINENSIAFIPIERRPKTRFHQAWVASNMLLHNYAPAGKRFYLSPFDAAQKQIFDLVLVNDAEPLSLAFTLAKGAPVVFDAHEYYPREFEQSFIWRLLFQPYLTKLCREYIPRCKGMTTVCPGLALAYKENFGILPNVVYNAPEYHDLSATPVQPDCIRLIHHGAANPDRCIELMIEMMDYVDTRFSLDLYLVGEGKYIEKLKTLAASKNNIRWQKPVPMQELTLVSSKYDIGAFLAPPTTFNLTHCLPNKFFEFIQARLGIAIGPSPEMANIVQEHDLGIIADDFSPQSLAAQLNALTIQDIARFKNNSALAAKLYTAQASMTVLKNTLFQALQQ